MKGSFYVDGSLPKTGVTMKNRDNVLQSRHCTLLISTIYWFMQMPFDSTRKLFIIEVKDL